ncbi:hypothetical protein [Polaromonas sp.]|uniref:hypothetical protein n=1 Tax=Polaromonas sp. TaxID=1869339 RepID=UPI0025EDD155|nr:hypothetical protein [Polaromonas sp.]
MVFAQAAYAIAAINLLAKLLIFCMQCLPVMVFGACLQPEMRHPLEAGSGPDAGFSFLA